jgi:transporter family protein
VTVRWLVPTAIYVVTVGGLGIASKLALRTLQWPALILWTGIGYIVVAGVLLIRGDTRVTVSGGTGWAILAAALAIGGLVALNIALSNGQASKVVPITAAYPAVTLLLAAAVLSERVTLAQWGGTALIIAGVLVLSVTR